MAQIVLRTVDDSAFKRLLDKCGDWARAHQAEIGVGEMALGASILSWGVISGQVCMGTEVVGSTLGDIGGLTGLGLGAGTSAVIAATVLKGLFVGGVAGVAGVTAVPAAVLIAGGALIAGAFGYVVVDKIDAFLNPPGGFGDLLSGASIIAVGLALMIDGGRRIIKDERVLAVLSSFKDGVIELVAQATGVIATTLEELQALAMDVAKAPSAWASAGATGAAGVAIGGSIAAGTVTVAGSQALGAVALSLGLVSAPVWPLIAGGAAGLLLGVAAWKGVSKFRSKNG